MFFSSGDTTLATTSDTPITLFTIGGTGSQVMKEFCLTHTTASVPFEISLDGGQTWLPCNSGPNGASVSLPDQLVTGGSAKLRRIPGGSNVSGIYAWATAN